MRRLLLATANPGKARELAQLLEGSGWSLVTLADLGLGSPAEEAGADYQHNAILKAVAAARASGLPALADDSGLEVDALGGAPGPMSARYGGEAASYGERMARIIGALKGLPPEQRGARFRCVVVVALPTGETHSFEGLLEGRIAEEPTGVGGFGYDPVFYLPERGLTLAELPTEEKNAISHRGRAIAKAREFLKGLSGE